MRTAVRISKFTYRSMSQSFSKEIKMDKCRGPVVAVEFRAGGRLLGNYMPISRKNKGNRSDIPWFLSHSGIMNKKKKSLSISFINNNNCIRNSWFKLINFFSYWKQSIETWTFDWILRPKITGLYYRLLPNHSLKSLDGWKEDKRWIARF